MIAEYSFWPKKIVAGPGSMDKISEEVKRLGKSRLILFTDEFLTTLPLVQDAMKKITDAGIELAVFNKILPNPTEAMVYEAVDLMNEFKPDCILIIGGGSPLDCAKGANVVYTHGGKATDYDVNIQGFLKISDKLLPMIAVPTTSGSGSETSAVGVITSTEKHLKFGIMSPFLIPAVAILDANITLGLGAKTTAFTGVDALTHCIEAYVSIVGSPVADGMCLQGIKMIKNALPVAYKDGKNVEARDQMIQAANLAGIAFTINNLGLCHQMAHQLSAYFDLPHGMANAILLPYVMKFNMKANPKKFADIAAAMGVNTFGMSDEEAAVKGIEAVENFCRELEIPQYLDEVGVDKAKVHDMAVTALQDGVGATNPIRTTVEECEAVYLQCFKN